MAAMPTDDPLNADLSPGGMLLGGPSLKCFGLHFRCTATDITATSAGSMALSADADDDAREAPAANATTAGACHCPLAMAFGT